MATLKQITTIKNKENLLLALEHSLGLVTPACKSVGLSRKVFYDYYKQDEVFRAAVDEINTIILDFAENALFKNIKDGDTTAITYFLRYRGKSRGYGDEGDTFGPTTVVIKFDDDK